MPVLTPVLIGKRPIKVSIKATARPVKASTASEKYYRVKSPLVPSVSVVPEVKSPLVPSVSSGPISGIASEESIGAQCVWWSHLK